MNHITETLNYRQTHCFYFNKNKSLLNERAQKLDTDILYDNNNLTVLLLGEELLDGCEHQRSGVNGERN